MLGWYRVGSFWKSVMRRLFRALLYLYVDDGQLVDASSMQGQGTEGESPGRPSLVRERLLRVATFAAKQYVRNCHPLQSARPHPPAVGAHLAPRTHIG